jgi:hypothetical protein
MSKGKPGSKSRFQKGFYRYYLTSPLFGIPLYNVSREATSRLEPEFFDIIREFEQVTDLFIQILIYDRGVKSFKTFKKICESGKDFICWAPSYKTIKIAIKRRAKLKMNSITSKIKETIHNRKQMGEKPGLAPAEARMRDYITRCIPLDYLESVLAQYKKKRKNKSDQSSKDFISIRDHEVEFEDYGTIRSIFLEQCSGKRMIIFTSIKREVAGPVEVLLLLKRRQNIEDFFAYKNAINGGHIFIWDLIERKIQKTKKGNIIKCPSPAELVIFEKKLQRAENKLKNLRLQLAHLKKSLNNDSISKIYCRKLCTKAKNDIENKKSDVKELKAFVSWGKNKKIPRYFKQFEKVMRLNYNTEQFINVINDLYFVISRQIAVDWAFALSLAKDQGIIEVKEKIVKEIERFTPEKLNYILLKGGGKLYKDPNTKNKIITEIHCEYTYKNQNLIAPYLNLLNLFSDDYKYNFSTNYSLIFTANLQRTSTLVNIVDNYPR